MVAFCRFSYTVRLCRGGKGRYEGHRGKQEPRPSAQGSDGYCVVVPGVTVWVASLSLCLVGGGDPLTFLSLRQSTNLRDGGDCVILLQEKNIKREAPEYQKKMRGRHKKASNKERFLQHAVSWCPEVNVEGGGVPFRCLMDSGSNVGTLTESFFRHPLCGEHEICTEPLIGLK